MVPDELTFNIVILGDEGVGKTALITEIVNRDWGCDGEGVRHNFRPKYQPTIGIQIYTKYFPHSHEDQSAKINIWDTSGKIFYEQLTSSLYEQADAVVIVFDVNNYRSFQNATSKWLVNFRRKMISPFGRKSRIMLVGNKIDAQMLEFTDDYELSTKASKSDVSHWRRVSAKTGEGVSDMFREIVNATMDQRWIRHDRLTTISCFGYTSNTMMAALPSISSCISHDNFESERLDDVRTELPLLGRDEATNFDSPDSLSSEGQKIQGDKISCSLN